MVDFIQDGVNHRGGLEGVGGPPSERSTGLARGLRAPSQVAGHTPSLDPKDASHIPFARPWLRYKNACEPPALAAPVFGWGALYGSGAPPRGPQ